MIKKLRKLLFKLTGHLVSTLHNNAVGAITRLQSMGIPSYNIASSVSLIIAQRLIRKLCFHCKLPEILSHEFLHTINVTLPNTFYRAVGCQHCLQGYQDRIGIYELLPISDSIAQLINIQNAALDEQLKKENFISLRSSGLEKVAEGTASSWNFIEYYNYEINK